MADRSSRRDVYGTYNPNEKEKVDDPELQSLPDAWEAQRTPCGIVVKHPQAGVFIQFSTGDYKGVSYGAICGEIDFNPSVGISFVYENQEGAWQVSITGYKLHDLARYLTGHFQVTLHPCESVTSIVRQKWEPPEPEKA